MKVEGSVLLKYAPSVKGHVRFDMARIEHAYCLRITVTCPSASFMRPIIREHIIRKRTVCDGQNGVVYPHSSARKNSSVIHYIGASKEHPRTVSSVDSPTVVRAVGDQPAGFGQQRPSRRQKNSPPIYSRVVDGTKPSHKHHPL